MLYFFGHKTMPKILNDSVELKEMVLTFGYEVIKMRHIGVEYNNI